MRVFDREDSESAPELEVSYLLFKREGRQNKKEGRRIKWEPEPEKPKRRLHARFPADS